MQILIEICFSLQIYFVQRSPNMPSVFRYYDFEQRYISIYFNIFTYFFINFRKKGKKSSYSTYKILKNFA
uniref:Uncharacterized protein n=1 Tax=Meloidogyne enterolobii TaxID=390850 RepID=A0A6V7VBQ9_MELEN|nr:unnamed protein product [Meloidogyne enterolobii]